MLPLERRIGECCIGTKKIAWTDPSGSRTLTHPNISRQSEHDGGMGVSPTHRLPLTPRIHLWYSFPLQAEATPGPYCGLDD